MMSGSYSGTRRSAEKRCGTKLSGRSDGSIFSHASLSSGVSRYSAGGLYDSALPGSGTLG